MFSLQFSLSRTWEKRSHWTIPCFNPERIFFGVKGGVFQAALKPGTKKPNPVEVHTLIILSPKNFLNLQFGLNKF